MLAVSICGADLGYRARPDEVGGGGTGGLNRHIEKFRGVLARYAPQNSKVTLHIVNDSRTRALCAYYRRLRTD